MLLLSEFTEAAKRAHQWTSFSPEKRGESLIKEYSQLLESDLALIDDEDRKAYYLAKFKSLFSCWLSRKANCFSSMITGGSNFPVRRHERANNAEKNAYDIFDAWRTKFFKRETRGYERITPDTELESARRNLESRTSNQMYMKAVNALCRKKNAEELLLATGLKPATVHELLNPRYSYQNKGFQAYELTNNNANIKHLTERVEILEAKIDKREELKSASATEEWDFEGGNVLVNYEADRVQVFFDTKPDKETRDNLCRGFNWSPSNMAWQRKITGNALYDAKQRFKPVAATV
jgi:hypothetical protein